MKIHVEPTSMQAGDKFPSFSLPNQDGELTTPEVFQGKRTVIYFYPKNDTSGCTAQACSLNDNLNVLGENGVQVIGVSPDGVPSHKKFIKKFGLNFMLLADEEKALCQALGIWVEKSLYGKKYMGVERTTYLVDEQGVIAKVWSKVKPQDHAQFLIDELGLSR